MKNYPTIQSLSILFTVTILGSVSPTVIDQIYIQGSEPLLITFENFKVLPSSYEVGQSYVEIYIFTDVLLPQKLDLECECI